MYFDTVEDHDWDLALHYHGKNPEDKFAHTFKAKANSMGLWDHCVGWHNAKGEIMGAIIVRVNKRQPVANLQLLHTFSDHRRKGVARLLVEKQFEIVADMGAQYFRVSAEEDAVPFYRALGFKFWGRQKSGCLLSMFRICGPTISEGQYDIDDPVINRAMYTKARGGLVEVFEGGAC